ncbi:hypothetical protein TI10_15790 [Photorhabdus luminescens subsp. luminescens]|uniref:Uncharacterized protein n=1 Tax=Photorhabdus luminescens TaxID=29488 RepID=A0A1G5RFL9_PHOLU|nr:hypothetical protein [Photorhabdus luminescens]KMW72414.1 hypothetical protein TI10_15790 [Photorhabdus luminescens subsp. luminescens]SCZ72853.1 hypothetical protein SAMN02982990_04134 [Photorhabdus luminescens]
MSFCEQDREFFNWKKRFGEYFSAGLFTIEAISILKKQSLIEEMMIKKSMKNISLFAETIFRDLILSHTTIIPPGTQLATNQNTVVIIMVQSLNLLMSIKFKVILNLILFTTSFSELIDTAINGKLNLDLAANWETKDNKV